MADIRPVQLPAVRPDAPRSPLAGARAAAQRAFFEAAMTSETPTAAPERMTRAPDLTIQIPPEAPAKILRPGSLVNILV